MNKMEKRIGYGLSFENALKLVAETVNKIQGETVAHINISTDHHSVIWAELRDDGWRVYLPNSVSVNMTKEDTT